MKVKPLDEAGFLQRCVSAVLGDRFEGAGGKFYLHEPVEFGNPNPFYAEVRGKGPLVLFDVVEPDAAFLFRKTTVEDSAAALAACSSNAADPSHRFKRKVQSNKKRF